MSTDLQTILQNNPALVQTGLDEDTLAVAGGATSGAKRISIRGKNFHKVVNGKEVSTIEDNFMNVVIIKMAHNASRTYYASSYKQSCSNQQTKECRHLQIIQLRIHHLTSIR